MSKEDNSNIHPASERGQVDTSGAGSKQRIMRAAIEEFGLHGYAGARVDRIARGAGINKAMIYYHYSSKENLYREVIKAYIEAFVDKLRHGISANGSIEEILGNIAAAYSELFRENAFVRPVILRELAASREEFLDQISYIFDESEFSVKIRSILMEGVSKGDLRDVDLVQAGISFILMNLGYFIMSPVLERIFGIGDRDKFIGMREKAVVDLFLNGMKAR